MKAKKRYSRNIILLAIIFLILCLLFRKIVFRNNTPVFYLTVLNLNKLKTVSPNTVIHEHVNIHRALKYA